jgi:formamidopyrimidine-DNA glycosylase
MPELPEVETIVRELREKVLKRTFIDVWADAPKLIKFPKKFDQFKKEIKGKSIKRIIRIGKMIIFSLSGDRILLVHQKMTGHFLIGRWKKEKNLIRPISKGFLQDPANRFIHIVFYLDKGIELAFSDLRKFARVELLDAKKFDNLIKDLKLGPDAIDNKFSLRNFSQAILAQKRKIKQVLMDQHVIAGIGNIYADESLFKAKINPFRSAGSLSQIELKKLYLAIRMILKQSIKVGGDSISDYRRTDGSIGGFGKLSKVYGKEGKECPICGEKIERKKIGGRSAHFCPRCQK